MTKSNMRLQAGQKAPEIKEYDHSGKRFELGAQRRLTMLQFHRYVGCPVCHLHVHDYLEREQEWRSRGVDIVVFYYSTPEEVVGVGRFPTHGLPITFICDPKKKTYRQFGIESSLWGTLSLSAWRDGALALLKGHSFRKAFPRTGLGGLPADFLIDEKRMIRKVRYGKTINDSLPVDGLLAWLDDIAEERAASSAGVASR